VFAAVRPHPLAGVKEKQIRMSAKVFFIVDFTAQYLFGKMMKTKALAVFLYTISFVLPFVFHSKGYADQIVLADGVTAETAIVDTAGCKVTIKRNKINVVIDKNKIEYIVWGTDTIRYKGFVCTERHQEAKPAVNFKDTPEYRLMTLFDNSPVVDRPFNDSSNLAFIAIPLEGFFDAKEVVGVLSPVFDILQTKAKVSRVSLADIYGQIESLKPDFDYIFVLRSYHVTKRIPPKNLLSFLFPPIDPYANKPSSVPFSQWSIREKKWILNTEAMVLLYDVKRKEVVFTRKLSEKRSVYGESKYSSFSILTPDKIEEAWEKRATEKKLEKNAKGIRSKMIKEVVKYLGLKK
jgi:hypothetical protein